MARGRKRAVLPRSRRNGHGRRGHNNPAFQAGVPKAIFQSPLTPIISAESQGSLTQDGKRFLFAAPTAQSAQAPFRVVLNWQAGSKK